MKYFGCGFFYTFLLLFNLILLNCNQETNNQSQQGNIMPNESIEIVLKENTDTLMAIPGVIGTAQGLFEDKPCIIIYVIQKTSEIEEKIPKEIDGYKVNIEVTGEIKAL